MLNSNNSERFAPRTPLDAKLHQGYDPTTEFAEKSNVFSAIRYQDDQPYDESFAEESTESAQANAQQNDTESQQRTVDDHATAAAPDDGITINNTNNVSNVFQSGSSQDGFADLARGGTDAFIAQGSALSNAGALSGLSVSNNAVDSRITINNNPHGGGGGRNDPTPGTPTDPTDPTDPLQPPVITLPPILHCLEDTSIQLNIVLSLPAILGLVADVVISGLPIGVNLSAGTNNHDGTWTLSGLDLVGLALTPALHDSGTYHLTVTANATLGTETISVHTALDVVVDGVATLPSLDVHAAVGLENTAIALSIDAALQDTDGSENLVITIGGVPTGCLLSAGHDNQDGTWTLIPADLISLALTPPHDFNGVITLNVTATSSENGTHVDLSHLLTVTVGGVADAPILVVDATINGLEDTAIALNIQLTPPADGSEHLSVQISGVPLGAVLSAGSYMGLGCWSISPADSAGLTLTPPHDFSGTIALDIAAISTEQDGDTAIVHAGTIITVTGVADAPLLNVQAMIGGEDQAILLPVQTLLGDLDGSEHLSITIGNVPTGAVLSAGLDNHDGTWSLTPLQLIGLTITPPQNSDADFTLQMIATATEQDGDVTSTVLPLHVTVNAIADIPTANAANTWGIINVAIPVSIGGALTDTDGSETLSFIVRGVPDGFALNHGVNNGNNSWTLTAAEIASLQINAPYDFEGRLHLTASAIAHDGNSTASSLPAGFHIDFGNAAGGTEINLDLGIGVAGINVGLNAGIALPVGGLLNANGLVVIEDTPTLLPDASLLLGLASGISLLTISGLPIGTSLSAGTNMGGGVWEILPGQLAGLTLTPAANSDQDFTLTIQASLLGLATVTLATTLVHVIGVADLPAISVSAAVGVEGCATIPVTINAGLLDLDGSEHLSLTLQGLPTGIIPTVGIANGDGTWSVQVSDLANLSLQVPQHWSGDASYTVVAVATEQSGDTTIHTIVGNIHVDAVADAPLISISDMHGMENQAIALNLNIGLRDTDGSEQLSGVTISGLPVGATLSHATDNHNGSWSVTVADLDQVTLTPPEHWSGDIALNVTATTTETGNNDHTSVTAILPVHIAAIAEVPTLSVINETGHRGEAIALHINSSLQDTDGSEQLSLVVSGLPQDAVLSHGMQNADHSWTLNQTDLHDLSITAPHDFTGDMHLSVTAWAQETSNGDVASVSDQFTVHVDAAIDNGNSVPFDSSVMASVGFQDSSTPPHA